LLIFTYFSCTPEIHTNSFFFFIGEIHTNTILQLPPLNISLEGKRTIYHLHRV